MQSIQDVKQSPAEIAQRVFGLIRDDMSRVEEEFVRQLSSNVEVVNYLSEYLLASGGKRLRPALLILAFKAVHEEASNQSVIKLATVMEKLHTATLVHDDIIDNSDLRRNRPSVNAKFGNQTAVLMGDWLYMSAFETSLEERNLEILDILTELTRKMTEGELIQLTCIGRTDISRDEYFDILERKTAYLFSVCCEIGAMLSDADDEVRFALRDYGKNLGISFQLADDLLDFTAEKEILGKESGADLLEGKLTLPLILLSERESGFVSELDSVMKSGSYKNGMRESIIEKLRLSGALEETRAVAYEYSERARKNLEILRKTEYRLALEAIPTYMIDRNK
ncbi:MAG: polyprenyl synthetase family protein [Pyrinomonadaceae bacterium]